MELVKILNGIALLKNKNTYYFIYESFLDVTSLPSVSELEEHFDIEGKFKVTPQGDLVIDHLQELYQFNCCGDLKTIIELINSISPNPCSLENLALMPTPNVSKEQVQILDNKFKADFSFNFKGQTITGTGTFIKYWFLDNAPEAVKSVQDLVELYVAISRIIARACEDIKDDLFLQCDDWIINRDDQRKQNGRLYNLNSKVWPTVEHIKVEIK